MLTQLAVAYAIDGGAPRATAGEPPALSELEGVEPCAKPHVLVTVAVGDRALIRSSISGGREWHEVRIVRRAEYAWLEYVALPLSDEQFCDHCGEDRNQGGEPLTLRIWNARHVCWTCYLNEPVAALRAADGGTP